MREEGQTTPICLKSVNLRLPQGEGSGLIFQQVSLWVADLWSDGLSRALGCLTRDVLCLQTLSFYFPPCGKIPPPVIMVQNVSFKYTKDGVSPRSCGELMPVPAWLGSARLSAELSEQAAACARLLGSVNLRTGWYRCNVGVLGRSGKA